ncbi:hypothetical protein [Marinagarivorans cellulosilyticus]|nr:hypothetical protein [Marinagarivorans cellulosilyticus]
MKEIGNKNVFCFVVGDNNEGGLQQVDIWANNTLLTPVDNMAYLPQFVASLENESNDINSDNIAREYMFFNHGPTTDDVVGNITLANGVAKLSFDIGGVVNLVSVSKSELLSVYQEAIEYLRGIHA